MVTPPPVALPVGAVVLVMTAHENQRRRGKVHVYEEGRYLDACCMVLFSHPYLYP